MDAPINRPMGRRTHPTWGRYTPAHMLGGFVAAMAFLGLEIWGEFGRPVLQVVAVLGFLAGGAYPFVPAWRESLGGPCPGAVDS
jgi:hypothetical protein